MKEETKECYGFGTKQVCNVCGKDSKGNTECHTELEEKEVN